MVVPVITHSFNSPDPQGPDLTRVYGPQWNAQHTITGLENVQNVDTTNASNITSGTLPAARLPSVVRQKLTASTTYFVDVTLGSDANSGLASGAGNAWKTIQHAVNYISQNIDLANFSITVQLADGTYPENLTLANYLASGTAAQATMIIQGNAAAHSNVIIQPSSGNAVTAVDVPLWWTLKNLRINAAGAGCIIADHSRIAIDGVVFGTANIHKQASNTGGMIEGVNNGYTIAVNAAVHDSATDGGEIANQALTVTGTGSMTFSNSFASPVNGGIIDYQNTTFAVTTTGSSPRFARDMTSSILCAGGADPNATIPGTSNGSITTLSSSVGGSVRAAIAATGRSVDATNANVVLTVAALPFIQNTVVLTAARTWTLPAANSVQPGDRLVISDAGGINGANTITVQRGGADTFSGIGVVSNAIQLQQAFALLAVASDGVSGWYLTDFGGVATVSRGGTGDTGTAWATYSPTLATSAGTLTSASATGRFKTIGKTVFFQATATITTNGTGSGNLQIGIPSTSVGSARYAVVGYESAVTGKEVAGNIPPGLTAANCTFYDGTYPGANSNVITISGVYESA